MNSAIKLLIVLVALFVSGCASHVKKFPSAPESSGRVVGKEVFYYHDLTYTVKGELYCKMHKEKMYPDKVIIYSPKGDRHTITNEEKEFLNALSYFEFIHDFDYLNGDFMRVMYCPTCRKHEKIWIEANLTKEQISERYNPPVSKDRLMWDKLSRDIRKYKTGKSIAEIERRITGHLDGASTNSNPPTDSNAPPNPK